MRNLTQVDISHLNDLLSRATTVHDVTAIARIAGGYRITRSVRRAVAATRNLSIPEYGYSKEELEWFKRPIGGAL